MSVDHEVIDLTESFTLLDHVVIELNLSVGDSSTSSPVPRRTRTSNVNRSKRGIKPKKVQTAKKKSPPTPKSDKKEKSKGFGGCPICWDNLGKNPLASTKCGHVFCLNCIKQVVKQTKQCPSCRRILRGAASYHPIYLSLQ